MRCEDVGEREEASASLQRKAPLVLFCFPFFSWANGKEARGRKWAMRCGRGKRRGPETLAVRWIEALLLSRSGLGPLLDELALPMRLSNGAWAGRGGWCRWTGVLAEH